MASRGADLRARDCRGQTPLHLAASRGNSAAVFNLLAAEEDGAKVQESPRSLAEEPEKEHEEQEEKEEVKLKEEEEDEERSRRRHW